MPTHSARDTKAARLVLTAAVLAVAGIAYLDWPLFLLDRVSGTSTDTLIQIALLQNWSNCLAGHGSCLSPNYFFPLKGTLGYNDGYLVSGVLYHLFRTVGFDPFVAYEAVYVVIRLIGFAAVLALGLRFLKLPPWSALLAAWLSLVSINALNQVMHTQLLYAAFIPCGLLLLFEMLGRIERLNDEDRRSDALTAAMLALAFGLFCAAWAMTAFYSFFYFMVFGLILVVAVAILSWRGVVKVASRIVRFPAVGAALAVGASLIPLTLWIVYGATLKETGGHAWSTTFNPRLQDLLNVGPDDIWSPVLAPLFRTFSKAELGYTELATGFPVLFFVLALVGSVVAIKATYRGGKRSGAISSDPAIVTTGLAVATAISIVAVLRIGGGYSLWYLAWNILPGASAIRVPSRFLLFATPVASLIVAYACARLSATMSARPLLRAAGVAIVFALLTTEQYNSAMLFGLDRQHELAFLQSIPARPAECRAFYISMPRYQATGDPTLDTFYLHAVDAMVIATLQRIPTLNGMASFQPKAWNLEAPFKPDYQARVDAYAAHYDVAKGLCSLNLQTLQWAVR